MLHEGHDGRGFSRAAGNYIADNDGHGTYALGLEKAPLVKLAAQQDHALKN
jgi:hypothetical protein